MLNFCCYISIKIQLDAFQSSLFHFASYWQLQQNFHVSFVFNLVSITRDTVQCDQLSQNLNIPVNFTVDVCPSSLLLFLYPSLTTPVLFVIRPHPYPYNFLSIPTSVVFSLYSAVKLMNNIS